VVAIIVIIFIKVVVLHMLVVVDVHLIIFIVDLFILLYSKFLLLHIGILAPPYHLNHIFSFYCDYFYQSSSTRYAIRGGHCDYGFGCGFAFVYLYVSSNTYWGFGAALSFKPLYFNNYF